MFFDRETCIAMGGVFIGIGSTLLATAKGWGFPGILLTAGVVMGLCGVVLASLKQK